MAREILNETNTVSVGQIKYHVSQWKKIINDPWVLKTIQGYEILFDEKPYQLKKPSQISFNDQETGYFIK